VCLLIDRLAPEVKTFCDWRRELCEPAEASAISRHEARVIASVQLKNSDSSISDNGPGISPNGIERRARDESTPVDTASERSAEFSKDGMVVRRASCTTPVELKKDFLRQLFSCRMIASECHPVVFNTEFNSQVHSSPTAARCHAHEAPRQSQLPGGASANLTADSAGCRT
jgi:hypothetical protein